MSLAQSGRFAEAADYEAQAIRLAEPTHHAYTVGLAHWAAGTLYLLKGGWAKASTFLGVGRGGDPTAVAAGLTAGEVAPVCCWVMPIGRAAWAATRLGARQG